MTDISQLNTVNYVQNNDCAIAYSPLNASLQKVTMESIAAYVIDKTPIPEIDLPTNLSDFIAVAKNTPTQRTFADRFSEIKNVKDYGAKGDGGTDDTDAIQSVLNTGGSIYFPPGVYVVRGLDITAYNTILWGDKSQNSTIFLKANSNRSVIKTVLGNNPFMYNPEIFGLFIDGNKSNQSSPNLCDGIDFKSCLNASVRNCQIFRIGNFGIHMYGDFSKLGLDYYITDNKIYDTGNSCVRFGGYCGTLELSGNIIGDCDAWYAVEVLNVDARIFGNHILGGKINGIRANFSASNCQIVLNHIESSGQHGIFIESPRNLLCQGNVVIKNSRNNNSPNVFSGIYVKRSNGQGGNNVVITNNICHSDNIQENGTLVQKYGIEFENADSIIDGIVAYNAVGGNATGGLSHSQMNSPDVIIENNTPVPSFVNQAKTVTFYDSFANTDLTKTINISVSSTFAIKGCIAIFELEIGHNNAGNDQGRYGAYHLIITKNYNSTFTYNLVKLSSTAIEPTVTLNPIVNNATNLSLNIVLFGKGITIRSLQKPTPVAVNFATITQTLI